MNENTGNSVATAKVIYILIIVSTIVGITGIIALIMAYVMKDGADEILATHYRFQIRTFWIGLLYTMIGAALLQVMIGLLILLFTFVWVIVRCARGLRWLERGEAVRGIESWLFAG